MIQTAVAMVAFNKIVSSMLVVFLLIMRVGFDAGQAAHRALRHRIERDAPAGDI
jgi:hypothetical protein